MYNEPMRNQLSSPFTLKKKKEPLWIGEVLKG